LNAASSARNSVMISILSCCSSSGRARFADEPFLADLRLTGLDAPPVAAAALAAAALLVFVFSAGAAAAGASVRESPAKTMHNERSGSDHMLHD